MTTTNPLSGLWNPEDAIRPTILDPQRVNGGNGFAVFSSVALGASPYDVLAGGNRIFYSPILDCFGYTNLTWVWNVHTNTGVVGQTLETDISVCTPYYTGSTGRSFADGVATTNLFGISLDYSYRQNFPIPLSNQYYFPLGYTVISLIVANPFPGAFTDLKIWFTGILSNPGFRT